jgi:hypothetical protein
VEESKPDWLAFLLLLLYSRRVGALAEPLAFRMATALFPLLADKAFLSSRSRAGDCLAAEIAFKKARSSCFSISCNQENVLVRINSLTGGEHSLSGRNLLRTLAYTFMYSCSTEYSEERTSTSLCQALTPSGLFKCVPFNKARRYKWFPMAHPNCFI